MKIKANTPMMVFRYNNYQKKNFILEHSEVLKKNDYVWMLKSGKKSSEEKISNVLENGGYMILKAPKAEGGETYIAKFVETTEKTPKDKNYPKYYENILYETKYSYRETFSQWFKVVKISKLDYNNIDKLVLLKGKKPLSEILNNCMTAVMFVENVSDMEI